ncbi:hypothetical protein BDR22DRAFT_859023 [Usnea florida]
MPTKTATAEDKTNISNAETVDGNSATNTSADTSGGDVSGPSEEKDGLVRAEVLDNDASFFKIRVEDEIIVDSGVVEEAMGLRMSPQLGDMIWVTLDADTKEVNKIYIYILVEDDTANTDTDGNTESGPTTVTATNKNHSKKVSTQSAVDSPKTDTPDGDTELGGNSQKHQAVADTSSAGGASGTGGTPVLASMLCNEMLNFEIELASNKKK